MELYNIKNMSEHNIVKLSDKNLQACLEEFLKDVNITSPIKFDKTLHIILEEIDRRKSNGSRDYNQTQINLIRDIALDMLQVPEKYIEGGNYGLASTDVNHNGSEFFETMHRVSVDVRVETDNRSFVSNSNIRFRW